MKRLSLEHRSKISFSSLGKKMSLDARRKMSLAKKGKQYVKGKHWKLSPEALAKNIASHPKGKSYNWKGGYANRLLLNRLRRNQKLAASGSHSEGDWTTLKAQYNWTCPCCKKQEPEIKLTRDHIVALTKGGSDNIENIQPLCQPCNSRKNNNHSTKYEH